MNKALKTLTVLFAFLMIAITIPQANLYVSAASSDYVKVTKGDSYNKNGKFYMVITVENLQKAVDIGGLVLGEQLAINASVVNSSGNRIQYWDTLSLTAGKKKTYNFGIDFSELPSGTYTLKLHIKAILADESWVWTFNINHKAPKSSMNFKSYETYYDDKGNYMHKFRIQCSNMKEKAPTLKLYNDYGDLVITIPGQKRKSNNEIAWFAWSGYADGVRYASGRYTVVVTCDGKTITDSYYLEILERARG